LRESPHLSSTRRAISRRGRAGYLPREWADDKARRKKAHVPASIRFKTKPQIALEQIRAALLASVPPGVALTDANYGNNSKLRQDLTGLGLSYVAAIQSTTKVRPVREDDPKPASSVNRCASSTI
jgi:SRSO17 transposase